MDAISDDGRHALTIIAFIGSVFSPYYRRALQRDPATDPENHCALNVCLYGPGANRWTMTERARRHVRRDESSFVIGPSAMRWADDELSVDIDERGMPVPHRVRGRVRLQAPALSRFAAVLDDRARHIWRPLAPCARIEVELTEPALRWRGRAYLDSNEGAEPLTAGFQRWDWLRATAPDGRTTVIYDTTPVHGAPRVFSRQFAPDGTHAPLVAPGPRSLPPTRWWRIARQVRAAAAAGDGRGPRIRATLEDTPFYARSLIELPSHDRMPMEIVHETLDARRLRMAVVPWLLPFRMPRRG